MQNISIEILIDETLVAKISVDTGENEPDFFQLQSPVRRTEPSSAPRPEEDDAGADAVRREGLGEEHLKRAKVSDDSVAIGFRATEIVFIAGHFSFRSEDIEGLTRYVTARKITFWRFSAHCCETHFFIRKRTLLYPKLLSLMSLQEDSDEGSHCAVL